MKDEYVSDLIRAGESQTIAFATADANVEEIGRAVCGFANAKGGTLIIGAKQGSVISTPYRIPNLSQELLNRISPHIAYAIREVVFQHRNLLMVDVPGGWDMPYTFDREIFVRVGKETRPADGLLVRELLAKRSALGPRWERQVAAGVSLGNLNANLLLKVAQEAEGGKRFAVSGPHRAIEILRELDLAEGDSLRNSAYALFGEKPDHRFPQMRVRAVAYRGKDQESLKDSRMIGGNLFEIVDKCWMFLNDHAPIRSEIPRAGLQRQQKAPFPLVAMREALLNAIIHRDYAPSDGSVSISIFSDRVEIWNIGGLPEGMTIPELSRVHASRPRNPDIAHLFMLHGQIERIGSGTRRILREFRSVGLPDPKWLAVSGGLLLTLPREKLAGAASSGQDLNPRQRAVLKNLQTDDAIRLGDYLERVPDVSERQARVDLKELVEMGFLRRQGQARQTEYVRTEKQFD